MCLLKIYVDDPETGERKIVAENVALIAIDCGRIKILNIDSEERILLNVRLTLIDALNSTVVLERLKTT